MVDEVCALAYILILAPRCRASRLTSRSLCHRVAGELTGSWGAWLPSGP